MTLDLKLDLSEAARAVGGQLVGPNLVVSSVSIDSRSQSAGALFVALAGERFDGHDFVAPALAGGARAALVSADADRSRWPEAPLIIVPDTRRALGQLSSWWRRRHAIPVIGIVGSNGKTTTKEMIAAILRHGLGTEAVLATAGNLNNDIGVPLTLLRLRAAHRIAVIEIGMNHPGETEKAVAMAQPTIGLVNNAQREHQAYMNSVEEVAVEHGSLITGLPPHGVVVINADDAFASYWRGLCGGRTLVDFGLDRPAQVTGRAKVGVAGTDLSLRFPQEEVRTQLRIPGLHNVRNALAAAAASLAAGLAPRTIASGLAIFVPAKGRLQVQQGAGGAVVIDDTYNANPDSVLAALDVLAGAGGGPKVLIFGDMDEVGTRSAEYHAEIGHHARTQGVDRVLTLGQATRATAEAFGAPQDHQESIEELLSLARDLDRPGATLLVKGSRFMKMERVVAELVKSSPRPGS
jgi:UDP-N-acetylmuramoyl-tripeptide--D-alanyl-D-alanine ligase